MTETRMDVPWQRTFEDLGSLGTGKRHVIKIGREAVPIVFVPGIMGTRLKARMGGAPIWDPDDSWFMLKRFGLPGIDPRDRQATILGATRTYDSKIEYALPFGSEDTEHDRDIEEEFPNATRRGWSEVYWDVYRPIFSALHTARWPLFIARCFDLPVYACGYDWRGSARDAGRRLASRVASIMAEQKLPCRQVILVTHSMGGLVARSACKLDGLEKNVLGIVHVVQPVTGAPSAYWRMKVGLERKGGIFDRITSLVVGANGLEVTSLVANLPGGLQLLPNRDHRANDGRPGWLRFVDRSGRERRLPEQGDPYAEIYAERSAEWRLIRWPEYIAGRRRGEGTKLEVSDAWRTFRSQLEVARTFHAELGLYRHPLSHHIVGKKDSTVDLVSLRMREVNMLIFRDERFRRFVEADERGCFRLPVQDTNVGGTTKRTLLEMSPPDGDGDGTVPCSSGGALSDSGSGASPLMFGGRNFRGTSTASEGAGHDSVFKKSAATLRTVVKVVQALCAHKIEKELAARP